MTNLNNVIKQPLTPPKNFFKWCKSHIPVMKWSNKDKTILSSNRKNCPIISTRLAKNSRLDFNEKFYSFAIVLVSRTRIEIQSYSFWHSISQGKETLSYELSNIERFSENEHIQANHCSNNWEKGLVPNYGYMSSAYTNTKFYNNDWQNKLNNNNDMKYLKLPKIDPLDLRRIYKYRQKIEFLQKIKATNLANQVMFKNYIYSLGKWNSDINMSIVTKKWLKKNKNILKKENPDFNTLMIKQFLQKRRIKMIEGIDRVVYFKQLELLPNHLNLNKFQKWIIGQDICFDLYIDYLNMLEELEIPLNESIVFPKNLQQAHDDKVAVINKLEKELKENSYTKRLPKIQYMEKEIDEFVFLVPKNLESIVNEGKELHHCVGSNNYLTNHSTGKTTIIFIRQKENINKPFFTLEYKDNHVYQVQGKQNRADVPNEVTQAIQNWEKAIKQVS